MVKMWVDMVLGPMALKGESINSWFAGSAAAVDTWDYELSTHGVRLME